MNRATGFATERYRYTRFDGRRATIDIAPSLATDKSSLRAKLLDGVTNAAADPEALASEITEAVKVKPPKHFVYERRTGWILGSRAFVLQNELIGTSADKIIGILPVDNVTRGKTRLCGTAGQWTKSVGELAKKSTTMMFAIATALSTPLLKITNTDTFGICLFGRTRGGKTMATLSAGSVLGFGREEQMLNWYSTTAGLEPQFPGFNDCILPIDDLSKLPVRSEYERYLEVRKLAYQAIGGDVKGRHPTFDNASRANATHHRFVVLTSFEKSIQDLAHEANQTRMGGETMRLIDVPAYFDGLMHIFDRAHADAELTQGELQKLFAEVMSACAENHGKVFRRYLRHLIARRTDLKSVALKYQRAFVKNVAQGADSTDAADLARKFGLIYAGGRMGIDAGVIHWKKVELLEAITKCYDSARSMVLDEEQILTRGTDRLRSYLIALPKVSELKANGYANAAGYVKPDESVYRCRIRVDAYSRLFESRHQQKLVTARLMQERKIVVAAPRTHQASRPQDQFSWPHGERVRSYEILWGRLPKSPT
jgi:hypothetical protein